MRSHNLPTDEDLLCSEDPEAFGLFYDRHVRGCECLMGRAADACSGRSAEAQRGTAAP
jgi:hypothetical protein